MLVGDAAGVPGHHAREVGAGTEGLVTGTGQYHHPDGRVGLGPGHLPDAGRR